MPRRLTALIHGESGAGKSWLLNTMPKPALLLDAEGRSDMLADLTVDPSGRVPQRLVHWDPTQPPPPEAADPSALTVVDVDEFSALEHAYNWLRAGQHPFLSLGLDSYQEAQQRLIDSVAGMDQMRTQDWGTVLRQLDGYTRKFRDLRKHKTNPLWAVVIVAGSQEKNGKQRALLQGSMATRAPYHFDLVGYLNKELDPETGRVNRYLSIDGFVDGVEAKDNSHLLTLQYGARIYHPNVSEMLAVLNPQETQ